MAQNPTILRNGLNIYYFWGHFQIKDKQRV